MACKHPAASWEICQAAGGAGVRFGVRLGVRSFGKCSVLFGMDRGGTIRAVALDCAFNSFKDDAVSELAPKQPENSPQTTSKPKANRGGARPGAGRKRIAEEDRRSATAGVMLTPVEYAMLARSAEDRGLSLSDYCRLRLLGKKMPPIIPTLD
jgi:hypothetical protein